MLRMVIGHYMRNLWQGGGIASYVRRLSAAQRAQGHTVWFFDAADAVAPGQRAGDVVYCDQEAQVMGQAMTRGVQVLHTHCALPLQADMLPVLRSVHTHSPYCPSGGRYLKRPDRPCQRPYSVGGCLWGYAVDRCGSLRPKSLRADFATTQNEQQTLGRVQVAVPSAFVRQQMLREGYEPPRVHLLPLPGPAPARMPAPPPPGQARFVFAGRLTPHKGLAWLIESMAQLNAEVELDVAGDGNECDHLKQLARRLGVEQRVRFHGWLEEAALQRLIDAARALVFPSRWHEPFGLVSLEAMARGRAVIAANVGALPEVVVDEQTGLLVEVMNRSSLARAMDRLARDPALAGRLGQAGRQRVAEHYTMDEHLQRLMHLYERSISESDNASGAGTLSAMAAPGGVDSWRV
jgi:glycosyltransferase involved in cell wall biosynthesis